MSIPLQVFIQLGYLLRYCLIFLCGGASRSSGSLVLREGEPQQWRQVLWERVCQIPQRLALNPDQGWVNLSHLVTELLYLVWWGGGGEDSPVSLVCKDPPSLSVLCCQSAS